MGMVAAESGWLWELTGEFGREVAACLYYWAMGFIQKNMPRSHTTVPMLSSLTLENEEKTHSCFSFSFARGL